ncbi:hypothetical protein EYF80_012743 [Liparis tanakae]|uniref:Uncharacterized protein n=1 Tax=Liparis tanakae TaxID=230148 RepID=A0A4Z2IHE1_9TELE|nr:hypothetical protein EYF80_012743 [Liparis tanakae]
MPRQVGRDDLIAQPREEVHLAAPNVQRTPHTVHEEQRHVRVRPFAAGDHPLGVDLHRTLGLAAAAAGRWSGFLVAEWWSNSRRNRVGVWRRGHFFVVSQLHLYSAARLQIPILTLQDLRVQNIPEILNHQLAVAVDGDLPLAVDTAARNALAIILMRAVITTSILLFLASNLLFGYYWLTLRDDVPHSQDSPRFHLHKLETIRGFCCVQRQDQTGNLPNSNCRSPCECGSNGSTNTLTWVALYYSFNVINNGHPLRRSYPALPPLYPQQSPGMLASEWQ